MDFAFALEPGFDDSLSIAAETASVKEVLPIEVTLPDTVWASAALWVLTVFALLAAGAAAQRNPASARPAIADRPSFIVLFMLRNLLKLLAGMGGCAKIRPLRFGTDSRAVGFSIRLKMKSLHRPSQNFAVLVKYWAAKTLPGTHQSFQLGSRYKIDRRF